LLARWPRAISGSHKYTDEDGFTGPVRVQVTHENSAAQTVGDTLNLTDPPVQLTAATTPFVATEGTTSAVQTLATFTDPGGAELSTDYSVQVDWGNGVFVSDANVTISGPNSQGVFTISGSHNWRLWLPGVRPPALTQRK
jgi:hypothetical protein